MVLNTTKRLNENREETNMISEENNHDMSIGSDERRQSEDVNVISYRFPSKKIISNTPDVNFQTNKGPSEGIDLEKDMIIRS